MQLREDRSAPSAHEPAPRIRSGWETLPPSRCSPMQYGKQLLSLEIPVTPDSTFLCAYAP